MLCEKCGKEVKAGAKFCDKCGAPIQQKEKRAISKKKKIIFGIPVGFLGICAAYFLSFGISWFWKYMFPPTDGKLVKEEEFNCFFIPVSWQKYSYDEAGNLMQIKRSKNYYHTLTEYSYDSSGNLLEGTWQNNDNERNYRLVEYYSYDGLGNLFKKEEYYISDGEVTKAREYSYDNSGNLLNEVGTSDGYIYIYDDDGKLSEKDYYEELGGGIHLQSWTTYSYDDEGRLTREDSYDTVEGGSELISWKEYSYDNTGRLRKEIRYNNYAGKEWGRIKYSYDRAGNLIQEVDYRQGDCIRYTYK